MHTPICEAIRSRRVIRFQYHGGARDVEPHAYGRNKNGNDLLRAYQVSGASESGERTGWKLFRVDEMRGISVTDTPFQGARGEYDQFDDAMEHIYCRL